MKSSEPPLPSRQVVLLGVGHTNAHIVRMWKMQPFVDAALTCISDRTVATYSGMLPAVLAQQNTPSDMQIDLVRLCASVGARLIVDDVTSIDQQQRLIHLADRPPVPFDVLSIGVGSVPTTAGTEMATSRVLKIKPMQTFLPRLEEAVTAALQRRGDQPLRVVVAGSGVAGTEIAFCLRGFLDLFGHPYQIQMVTRSREILSGAIPSFRRRAEEQLDAAGIAVTTGKPVIRVDDDGLHLNDGQLVPADLVIWATGATPPPLLKKLGLPLTDRGFLATDSTLRVTSAAPIFAVGDTGTIVTEKLPKAGVYAVRQGPVLWQNLERELNRQRLLAYEPQRSFLKLLNTGDGSAIGELRGFSFSGTWVKRWKDFVDGRFMKMYQTFEAMDDDEPMQCRGCGCKLGGDVLSSVVSAVAAGSEGPALDDAAVLPLQSGGTVVASTDFFTSPFRDAWLSGRVAALHSASDLVAMGASVNAALANVVLPEGPTHSQQQVFADLMAGARREFEAMGATVAGGHTIVGPRLEIGFTVFGEPQSSVNALLCKANLRAGDRLYLTKPLGIGVLLAAHMRQECRAADFEVLVATMLEHQSQYAAAASQFDIRAATDVTGFGLAGHLLEMLDASEMSAHLKLASVPLLPGAAAALDAGIESTLAPGNRHVQNRIVRAADLKVGAEYPALFDPQTCGGLLLAVPPAGVTAFEQKFADATCPPVFIGKVTPCDTNEPQLHLG
ncbi:MAG: selenide, water dikinase SelD [Planctomycetaceae bacterium]|nr:selenide, water dikinase SelD [Planctomycetaceae bacterium]